MKARILVVDDSPASVNYCCRSLQQDYDLATAETGQQCLELIQSFQPDLVLLDVVLPDLDGFEICQRIKQSEESKLIPQVIMLTSIGSPSARIKAYEFGADDYLSKPCDPDELRAKVKVHVRLRAALNRACNAETTLANYSSELERLVDARTAAIQSTQDVAVFALANLADSRDPETGDHLVRMRYYSQLLAEHLSEHGPYTAEIDETFLHDLYRSSPLHDIGKVGISDSILLKPGKLTPEEYAEMQRHAAIGAKILAEAAQMDPSGTFFEMATTIAEHHHERWDGAGYPHGLSGPQIPLVARIVALADVFDAISSDRVYRPAMPLEQVTKIILEEEGKHFDPAVVDAFRACYDDFLKMVNRNDVSYGVGTQPSGTLPRWRVHGERSLASVPQSQRVLVVDDDESQTELLVYWLRIAGYDAVGACSVDEAIESIREECPQFLISDWKMPRKTGGDLCRWVRSEPLPRYVYTIVLTAWEELDAVDVFNSGADDFLHKPIQRSELLARLRSASRVVNLEAKLSELSRVDPLTGLPTSQSLQQQMQREWDRANRHRLPLSCAMLSIDGIDQIAAEQGEAARDAVTHQVATSLAKLCRGADYLYRHGSNQFAIVLPDTNRQQARTLVERISEEIKRTPVLYSEQRLSVNLCVGVAQGEESTFSLHALVEAAEQSLDYAMRANAPSPPGDRQRTISEPDGEEDHDRTYDQLRATQASDVMTQTVFCLRMDRTAREAAQFFLQHRLISAPIVDNQGLLIGSLKDVDLLASITSNDSWQLPIATLIRREVISFDEETPVQEIYEYLHESSSRWVVIVNQGRPRGIITYSAMLRWFAENEETASEPLATGRGLAWQSVS